MRQARCPRGYLVTADQSASYPIDATSVVSKTSLTGVVPSGLPVAKYDVVVTPLGRLFVRNVAMAFDAYVSNQERQRFSRTV